MDLKRNNPAKIQPPTHIKATNLMSPLLNIANASTPMRTRIVKPSSQLNSTPVNTHKMGVPAKSPTISNKQNEERNTRVATKPILSEKNINLSPIMALNRKVSQGVKQEQRSFTPTGFRKHESQSTFANHFNQESNISGNNQYMFGQTLKDSRSSNNFQSLIEARSKTPNRFKNQQLRESTSKINFNGLRTSGSAQSLLGGFSKLRDSKNTRLSESKSFEQLINLGTPQVRENDVLCSNSNDHEKKARAKYKVVDQSDDDDILVYCSKCAINLVKKGFKVEDLTQEDIYRIKNQSTKTQQDDNEYEEYAEQTRNKLKLKFNELTQQKEKFMNGYNQEIENMNCYYDSLIQVIEEQRAKDKDFIVAKRNQEKKNGEVLQKKLRESLSQIQNLLSSGMVGNDHLRFIQSIQILLTEKGFSSHSNEHRHSHNHIQQKFDDFTNSFDERLKLYPDEESQQQIKTRNYYSNNDSNRFKQDSALRFSFEKSLRQNEEFGARRQMNALEEAPEEMEGEESGQIENDNDNGNGNENENEKKAFRTLFPEEESLEESAQGGLHSPTFKQF